MEGNGKIIVVRGHKNCTEVLTCLPSQGNCTGMLQVFSVWQF